MEAAEIDIRRINSAPLEDLKELYRQANWLEDENEDSTDFLARVVQNSAIFVGAFYKKKLIGMGRALSDLTSDAYIQDVVVLKDLRNKGIGRKIIQMLVEKLKKNVDWIGLVAEPGSVSFYEDLGFQVLKDHVPLKYKGK